VKDIMVERFARKLGCCRRRGKGIKKLDILLRTKSAGSRYRTLLFQDIETEVKIHPSWKFVVSGLRNGLMAEQAGCDGVAVMGSEDYLLLTQTIY
jgi:hypothetical protein